MRKTSMGVRADSSQGSVEGGNLKAKDPKDPEDHGSDGSRTCFRPKRIVLIRHGESEGNVDELAYCSIPDHRIQLTAKGRQEAQEAGAKLREMVGPTGKAYFYVSPYVRTLQTALEMGKCLDRSQVSGAREEPRIREQDFGNLQDAGDMRHTKIKRLTFGRFFFRFPDGESAADVYDRVTGFRETIRNDIADRFNNEESKDITLVIVTHGISLRVFLMRWYKYNVQQFERLKNPANCEMVVMERGNGGRYALSLYHDEDWLRKFGMSDEMMENQQWHEHANPGDFNAEWPTSGPMYFDDLEQRIQTICKQPMVAPGTSCYAKETFT